MEILYDKMKLHTDGSVMDINFISIEIMGLWDFMSILSALFNGEMESDLI